MTRSIEKGFIYRTIIRGHSRRFAVHDINIDEYDEWDGMGSL
jgi:hypothetical protein